MRGEDVGLRAAAVSGEREQIGTHRGPSGVEARLLVRPRLLVDGRLGGGEQPRRTDGDAPRGRRPAQPAVFRWCRRFGRGLAV